MSYKEGAFKGTYSPDVKYSVGDVVIFENEVVYHLQKEAAEGTPPTDTRFWGQVEHDLRDAVKALADSCSGGGSGGVMLVHGNPALDKTFAEIRNALADGTIVILLQVNSSGVSQNIVSGVANVGGSYKVYFNSDPDYYYTAASENDYPVPNVN